MAKKQKRSSKKAARPNEGDGQKNADSTKKPRLPTDKALSQKEFVSVIAATFGILVYVMLFLFTKTEFGDRFWTYLVLLLNYDIYRAFWTGSPDGSFHLFDRIPILVGLLFHLGLAVGLGALILRLVAWKSGTKVELFTIATGLGLSAISTYTVLAGLLQLYAFKHVLVLPIVVVAVIGWFRLGDLLDQEEPDLHADLGSNKDDGKHWTRWIGLATIPFALVVVLASMLPPWEFDVREYHLQVPKEWYQQGGVSFLPHNVYGNMPLGTEMHALFSSLYTFGTDAWWWGILIGKSISGMFVILNALAIFCIGCRVASKFAGLTGSLIYLSTPWTIANGIIGYNESSISFYLLLSTIVVLELRDRYDKNSRAHLKTAKETSRGRGISFLLGLAIGSTMACKYTAIPFVAIPATLLFIVWTYRIQGSRQTWKGATWLIAGMLLVSGVWFAKNMILIGNPVYPLAESVFGSARSQSQIDQWAAAHSPDSVFPTSETLQAILSKLFLSFKWLSPLTVPFALLAVFGKQRKLVVCFLAYLLFVFLVWLTATHRLERFLLPFYSVVCVLAGMGAGWLESRQWKSVASIILLFGCCLNILFGSSRLVGDVRIFASMSDLNSRSLNARDYQHPEDQIIPLNHLSPTIAWLNQNRPNAKVLFFGECRPLTAEFEVIYNTCFDKCETWKRFSGKSADQILEQLQAESITHVLVNASEWKRFQSTYGYNVDDEGSPVTPNDLLGMLGRVFRRVDEYDYEMEPSVFLLEVISE